MSLFSQFGLLSSYPGYAVVVSSAVHFYGRALNIAWNMSNNRFGKHEALPANAIAAASRHLSNPRADTRRCAAGLIAAVTTQLEGKTQAMDSSVEVSTISINHMPGDS